MKAEFDVKLTAGDMFRFLMNHSYRKVIGIVWVIFSLVVVAVTVITWGKVELLQSVLLIVLASLYTIINPIMLWFKACKQVKNHFKEPLHYLIDENGITVSLGEASETTPWDQIWKAVNYGSQVVIYVTNIRVFNMPVRCMEGQYGTLRELAGAGLAERCYLKAER